MSGLASVRPLAVALLAAVSLTAAPVAAQLVFEPPIASLAGDLAARVYLGDVDEDGQLDAVVAHKLSFDPTPSLLRGHGDGSFAAPVPLPGGQPRALLDFNGDQHLDLLGADLISGETSVRLGDGHGGFGAAVPVDLPGAAAVTADVGDFDADGALDVASGNNAAGFSPATLVVSLGHGNGSFEPATIAATLPGVGVQFVFVHAGDTNGDGRDDLVQRTFTGSGVLISQAGGGFAPATCGGCLPLTDSDLVLADLNGDGREDALAPTRALLAGPTGSFDVALPLPVGADTVCVAAGDLDGDGHLDAIVGRNPAAAEGDVLLLRGLGNGTFAAGLPVSHVPSASGAAAGDLDGDGRPDVTVCETVIQAPALRALLNHSYGAGSPFLDLGFVLPGGHGAPILLADGTLQSGTPFSFQLANGPPGGIASLFVGFTQLDAPFKGGVMVPLPVLKVGPLTLDGSGGIELAGTWPAGGSGAVLYLQWWMPEAGAPKGFASSSAVRVTVP